MNVPRNTHSVRICAPRKAASFHGGKGDWDLDVCLIILASAHIRDNERHNSRDPTVKTTKDDCHRESRRLCRRFLSAVPVFDLGRYRALLQTLCTDHHPSAAWRETKERVVRREGKGIMPFMAYHAGFLDTPLPPTGTCLRTKKAQLPILLVQPTAANGALQKKWTVLGCEWDVSALDQFQSWCGTKATDPRPSNGVVAEAVQSVAVQLAANWAIVVTEAPKVLVVVLHEGHGADAPTVMGTAFVTGHPRTTIVLTNLFQTMSSRLFLGGDAILPHILEQRHNIEREHARLVCKANQDGLAARALVLEMLKDKPDTALITALTMALADQQEQTAHGSGVRTRWQQQKKDR